MKNEARWWFLRSGTGDNNWAREMVHRFVKTRNLKEMGFSVPLPDSFSCDCFAIIQEEIEKQKRLKEKLGKINR